MEIGKKMQEVLNEQIKNEIYSGYLYLAMANWCEGEALPGIAHWLRLQRGEEESHAAKFSEYVLERGGKVLLQAIPQPPLEWKSPLAVFENVLEHEHKVTEMIYKLYEVAKAEKDYQSEVMLHWFLAEQVEEEKNDAEIIAQLKMIEGRQSALLMLDHELGERK
jgi:ferritin